MMIRHRLAYFALWICSFLLYVFYVGYASWYIFIFVCILPILSLLYAWIAKLRFFMDLEAKQTRCIRHDEGSIVLHSKTNGILPIAKIQGTLHIHNTLTKETEEERIAFGSTSSLQGVELLHSFQDIGKYRITLSNLVMYDALGIFHFHMKQESETFMYCLPEPQIIEVPLPSTSQVADMVFDPTKKGNDRSVVFGVHEYQPGDSIHAIHWKLSAKMDNVMVRDFASFKPKVTSLCFDLYGSTLDVQEIIANVYGSSLYLLSNQRLHEIIQYAQSHIVCKRQIQTKEALDAFVCHMLDQSHSIYETSSLPNESKKDTYFIKKDGVGMRRKAGEEHG